MSGISILLNLFCFWARRRKANTCQIHSHKALQLSSKCTTQLFPDLVKTCRTTQPWSQIIRQQKNLTQQKSCSVPTIVHQPSSMLRYYGKPIGTTEWWLTIMVWASHTTQRGFHKILQLASHCHKKCRHAAKESLAIQQLYTTMAIAGILAVSSTSLEMLEDSVIN